MSQENRGYFSNNASGGLVGMAVGLVGSYFIDQAFSNEPQTAQTLKSALESGISRVSQSCSERASSRSPCQRPIATGGGCSRPRATQSRPQTNGSGDCAICLDSVSQTITTPCCRQLLHVGCHNELRNRQVTSCPLCRTPW